MDSRNAISELLATAIRFAADVAHARVGKSVSVGPGERPTSNALLRFDLTFTDEARLSWYVSNEDATGFSDLLIGGAGDRSAVLTEMHLDALSGVFSDMLERAVEGVNSGLTDPLTAGGVDMGMEGALPAPTAGEQQAVFALNIEGFGSLTVVEHVNEQMMRLLRPRLPGGEAPVADASAPASGAAAFAPADASGSSGTDNVVQLPNLAARESGAVRRDLSMLLNVPLRVTVELGRTERTIRDLLDLNVGSILELSKLAGDPMDIMVNEQVLARGEVVVIDEEFGIRITEICSPEDRLRNIT